MRIAIDWKKRGREFAILVGIGTFVAIINPYGATNDLPFWVGWMYWTGVIIYGSVVGGVAAHWISKWMEGAPLFLIFLIITTATAALITPALVLIHYLLGDNELNWYELPMLYAMVWVISAALTGIGILLHTRDEALANGGNSSAHEKLAAFMERLPLPYRNADLYAISSEDHYLRIHTSAGEHMMLERLANAVRDLEGADGLQTHRSWWVAAQGVKTATSSDGRISLELKSGTIAPVSRTYAKTVREAGWV